MSLNDKATAALTRELAKCFPERDANDPGHARLAAALSDTAHTPGPWMAVQTEAAGGGIQQDGWYVTNGCGTNNLVAKVIDRGAPWCGRAGQENSAANARLIAAAPELLEACKALAITLEEMWAEKELTAPKFRQCQLGEAVKAARAAIAKAEGGAK